MKVRVVRGRADLARFVDLPWKIYRNDPNWVPPLKASVRALLDVKKHPFYEGGKTAEAEEAVRVAAAIHPERAVSVWKPSREARKR